MNDNIERCVAVTTYKTQIVAPLFSLSSHDHTVSSQNFPQTVRKMHIAACFTAYLLSSQYNVKSFSINVPPVNNIGPQSVHEVYLAAGAGGPHTTLRAASIRFSKHSTEEHNGNWDH